MVDKSNVVRMVPREGSNNQILRPEEVAEYTEDISDKDFDMLMIVGQYHNGDLFMVSSHTAGVSLTLMEKIKYELIHGDD